MIVAFRPLKRRIQFCSCAFLFSALTMIAWVADAQQPERPIRIALVQPTGPVESDSTDAASSSTADEAASTATVRLGIVKALDAKPQEEVDADESPFPPLRDSEILDAELAESDLADSSEPSLPRVRTILVSLSVAGALRACDEVFEVSSRCLPTLGKCTTLDPVDFQISKLEVGGWRSVTDSEFQAHVDAQPAMRTVIYVHGNWMEAGNARNRGTYVYNRLSQRSAEPIRVILYTWPSQRDGRPIKDVLEKAERADVETYYFAKLLGRIPKESPLGVLGFSFGARVVGGGLHIAGGGTFHGRSVAEVVAREHVRVSLVAPAFDRNWLMPNQPYGLAIQNVDSIVNVYNSRDPVLRRFRFIDTVTSPIAAGFSGLPDPRSTHPLAADARIRQYDCSGCVGNSHDEMTYYRSCAYYNNAIDNVLGK